MKKVLPLLCTICTVVFILQGCSSAPEHPDIPSAAGIVDLSNPARLVFNPYLPSWEYVPDGEPRVFGDRLYVYGSHDAFDGPDFCVNDYVGWSAPLEDLSDWRYEGVIYRAQQDPRNSDDGMHMCAPDCVRGTDGRYYLYYQLHQLQCTSVAVSERPEGPFEYYGYVQHPDGTAWGERKGDSFVFDPAVLVDDDGKVYLYAGFSPKGFMRTVFKLRGNRVEESFCLRLSDDMKTAVGEEMPIVPGPQKAKGTAYEGHSFFEASSIRKIGAKYYYVYSSELSHELCYAVSDCPDRDFCYGGTLVSIPSGNTHGGMAELSGEWYIFYHRQTNRIKCSRQGCAEKIEILPDGNIPQAETTSCGLNGGPLPGKGIYEARIACNLVGSGYLTQTGSDREDRPDQYIADICDGSWCAFKYFRYAGDEKGMKVFVCGDSDGTLKVSLTPGGETVSRITVRPSGEWTEFSSELNVPEGVHPLYFTYEGKGRLHFYAFEVF